ncbi:aminotransferase class III-fold pyridoxal phosphate-dependent enzyme [Urbifossiella limnaea]|uniref:Acetylornithine/acetyl-lysine aminotransferase n=1 Tax=Urbifossiella limnaea TaxID=2528023 RepID=A0A517Y1T1_9BACT|nr:aminotransferase class III-fold pyridoxal phosphate-dependent enzyme [Urbifossiella limnaea]QDU23721.1 Acetylornithine/acetyl-lysine aminotransferase [Urbifossiella limnaea]
MTPPPPLADTLDQMLRGQLPNLLRLYLNPFVAQTCLCLGRYAETTWAPPADGRGHQTFLANSFDEALSGAIKLARYDGSGTRPATGLVIDPAGRLGPFASAPAAGGGTAVFVPGLVTDESPVGFVVLVPKPDGSLGELTALARRAIKAHAPLVITCVNRDSLAAVRRSAPGGLRDVPPDVVVFDESFVNRAVPFAAFTARKSLYDHWNRRGKATFHSTTYQPNTVSTLHFLNCLKAADPAFWAAVEPELAQLRDDLKARGRAFRRLYSPSLGKTIRAAGFDVPGVRAAGDFVHVGGRRVFDAVSGVACSIRGHNPPGYTAELAALPGADAGAAELAERLRAKTGLGHVLPAVSGASAIENALKLALVAQHPRRHVLALKSGYGGKTLLALAGTWGVKYKERIDPLYPDVLYADPFAPDAVPQLERLLAEHPVAVVQTELVQAVGGVRPVPEAVLRFLADSRARFGHLLLIDEVQTGMFRTGPFTRSAALGLAPDLLVLGKGTSDMMVPVALTLCSDAVARAGGDLPAEFRRRYGCDAGYRTVLNVLRRADELRFAERASESGELFARLLRDGLAGCPGVRDVRAFGLLVGVELDARRGLRRWMRKQLYSLYLLAMLRHPRFPVLAGFCQYEPNVLKLTPSLTAAPDDLRAAAATVVEVLRRPFPRVLAGALGTLATATLRRR